jgi:acetyltransferase-like isoleucine patch superfamily enzyme
MPNKAVTFQGMPWVSRLYNSRIIIGAGSTIVSDFHINTAGINHPTILATVCPGSIIRIGENTGMSGATVVSAKRIEIGNNTGLGVNVCIYDTDFHVQDPLLRRRQSTICDAPSAPVKIGDDVWIAANVIVLKGVTIGDRSIIGASSVVVSDVPPDSVFVGNPARFVRKVKLAKSPNFSKEQEDADNL